DQKPVDAAFLRVLHQLVTRLLAKCLEVRDGAWVGGKHLECPALRNLGDGLLRFQDGKGAVQSFRVEGLVGHRYLRESRTGNSLIFANSYTRGEPARRVVGRRVANGDYGMRGQPSSAVCQPPFAI